MCPHGFLSSKDAWRDFADFGRGAGNEEGLRWSIAREARSAPQLAGLGCCPMVGVCGEAPVLPEVLEYLARVRVTSKAT